MNITQKMIDRWLIEKKAVSMQGRIYIAVDVVETMLPDLDTETRRLPAGLETQDVKKREVARRPVARDESPPIDGGSGRDQSPD
jgi:hypothetical protein